MSRTGHLYGACWIRAAVTGTWAALIAWVSAVGVRGADLALSMVDPLDPVAVGQLVTCELTLTNQSVTGATEVTVTHTLPPTARFFSAAASQGSFLHENGQVVFALGSLDSGGFASLQVSLAPEVAGWITNSATVTAHEADPAPDNNTASNRTAVASVTCGSAGNLWAARAYHTATLLTNGTVLLAGGYAGPNPVATAEVYDPNTGRFSPVGPLQSPRYWHTATRLLDGRVLVAGGLTPETQELTSLEVYDPGTRTFAALGAALAQPRLRHTATLLPDGRVLFAGRQASQPVNMEIFDPATTNLIATVPLSQERWDHAAHLILDPATGAYVVVICAGFWAAPAEPPTAVEVFDPVAHTLTQWGALWPPRSSPATVVLGNRLFAVSGFDFSRPDDPPPAGSLDPVTRQFQALDPPIYHRGGESTATALADGRALIVGGENHARELELFDPTTSQFLPTLGLNVGRHAHTATLLPDGQVLIAGGHALGLEWLKSAELFDPASARTPPAVSIADTSGIEGSGTAIELPLTLSAALGIPVSVDFATRSDTATADLDFSFTAGTVVFPPGTSNAIIRVPLLPDDDREADESFHVALLAVTNAVLVRGRAVARILNDDEPPTVIVPATVSVVEANVDLTAVALEVTLSRITFERVSVPYATADGSATAAADYVATNGTLEFAPGTTRQTLTFFIRGDIDTESDEVFHVQFGTPDHAGLGLDQAAISIRNDDGLPGRVDHFTLEPIPTPQSAAHPVAVSIVARDAAGAQVTTFSSSATLQATRSPGDPPLLVFTIPVLGGVWSGTVALIHEGMQVLRVDDGDGHTGVSNPFELLPLADVAVSASVEPLTPHRYGETTFTLVVTNRGPSPSADTAVTNILPAAFEFLSAHTTHGVLAQSDGVIAGQFGVLAPGERATLTVVARPTTAGIWTNLTVVDTTTPDPEPSNNRVGLPVEVRLPRLFVTGASVLETDAGPLEMAFAVTLEGASQDVVTVDFATADASALAGFDYLPTNGTLVFPPGTTHLTLPVTVLDDRLDEVPEAFHLQLAQAVGAVLAQTQVTGTIEDNDPPPVLTVDDVALPEGASGTNWMVFTARLSEPSGQWVQVDYSTWNITAVWRVDYGGDNGYLRIAPGATHGSFTVPIFGNTVSEPDKTFRVEVQASRATPVRLVAIGTILNDDDVPGQLNHFTWEFVAGAYLLQRPMPLTLTARDAFNHRVTNYHGAVAVTLMRSGSVYDAQVRPTTLSNFVAGVWTGNLRALLPGSNLILRANDGQQHVGVSTAFDLVSAFPLQLLLPPSVMEHAGALSAGGRLTTRYAQTDDVTFQLESSDSTVLALPSQVVIPAGQTNATFDVLLRNDEELNGARSVVATAHGLHHLDATATLVVVDDESATLSLELPAHVYEGLTHLASRLHVSSPPDADVPVTLTGTPTNRPFSPTSVVVPAGSRSVDFPFTVPDDGLIRPAVPFTLTASVPGWTSGTASTMLLDSQVPKLALFAPAQVFEDAGLVRTGVWVQIPGPQPEPHWVALRSDYPTHLNILPPTPIIEAGSTQATFQFEVYNNAVPNPNRWVTLTADAPGYNPGKIIVTVVDDDLQNFSIDPLNPLCTANAPIPLRVQARNLSGSPLPAYLGTATVSASNSNGPVPLATIPPIQLRNGEWSGSVTIPASAFGVRLVVTADSATGTSNPFDVLAPLGVPQILEVSHWASALAWDGARQRLLATVPAHSQTHADHLIQVDPKSGALHSITNLGGDPCVLTLSDDARFAYVGFQGTNTVTRVDLLRDTVDLRFSLGLSPELSQPYHAAALAALPGHPESVAVVKASGVDPSRIQVLEIYDQGIPRSAILPLPTAAALSLVAAGPDRLYLAPPLTEIELGTAGVVATTGFAGVVDDPGVTLSFEGGRLFTSTGTVWSPATRAFVGHLPGARVVKPDLGKDRVFALGSVIGADPVEWLLQVYHPDTMLRVASLPLPTVHGLPADLVRWGTNGLAFRTSAGQVLLATSNLVPSGAPADLALGISAPSMPVAPLDLVTSVLHITNRGPRTVTEALLVASIPDGTRGVEARSTDGACQRVGNSFHCRLLPLEVGATASMSVVVSPTSYLAAITNAAVVLSEAPDPVPDNHQALWITPLIPQPTLSLADAGAAEPNTGVTPLRFAATLSHPSKLPVIVHYATRDETAAGGGDYQATNGWIIFEPGSTHQEIAVNALGDITAESPETFSLLLDSPSGAALQRGQAVGTILDNDGIPDRIHHFAFDLIDPIQYVHLPFRVQITARDAAGNLAPSFTDTASLTATTPGILPTHAGPFSAGTWTGLVTLPAAAANVQLELDDGDGHTGSSPPFTVIEDVDADGNGLPDGWELRFLATAAPVDRGADADADGDGHSNLNEFLAATDPNDADSRLQLWLNRRDDGQWLVRFPSAPGRRYRLEWNDTLATAPWVSTATPILGTGDVLDIALPGLDASWPAFFRLVVQP